MSKKESIGTQELKSSQILLFIVALLAHHFDFESLRSNDTGDNQQTSSFIKH